jgi:gas vesicle protein
MPTLVLAGAIGAALAYFFDPQSGRRRRKTTIDRTAALFRRTTVRTTQAVSSQAYATKQKLTHLQEEPKDFDDVTLARKVETEIFRGADVPKGRINVNVEEGVVSLRGEANTPEMINDLENQVRKIQGVRDVNNLLHLPNTPAPTPGES